MSGQSEIYQKMSNLIKGRSCCTSW